MSLTLTTDIVTRNTAPVVVVLRQRRASWQVAMDYSPTGGQEKAF
ncbi:MAG TPA: hypothetical protein VFZ59_21235 [Verrucomicrobiae bacterium]|nr:hypothetical protein [Verrucomicrobiae bacterium]